MLVETLYNKLAINTGFPLYTNEQDAPDTERFLLEMLNQALLNVIDNIYISNNVLERRDTIITSPRVDKYAVEGMVKNIQYTRRNQSQLVGKFIKFNRALDTSGQILRQEKFAYPTSYVIDRGDVRFFPTPDKQYEIEVTVSTTNLVWGNDDSSKGEITSITDSIMASKAFCDLVVLRACAFTMARCNNPLSEFYGNLYKERLRTFVERDSNSFEKPHLRNPRAGHYDPRRGLLG